MVYTARAQVEVTKKRVAFGRLLLAWAPAAGPGKPRLDEAEVGDAGFVEDADEGGWDGRGEECCVGGVVAAEVGEGAEDAEDEGDVGGAEGFREGGDGARGDEGGVVVRGGGQSDQGC